MARWKFKTIIGTVLFTFMSSISFAQQSGEIKQIEVGGWVKILPCKKGQKNMKYIDLYSKTRFPEVQIKVDTLTGEGLMESFFTPGDFDAQRLPCRYTNKRYKVAALQELEADGKLKRVMLLYTDKKNELIWVEFDQAVEQGEVTW